VPRPEAVLNFDQLYGENCAGCHGANGQNGAAASLGNPKYQALVDDASLRTVITHGEKGTLMPAFGISSGGSLTDAQINVLIQGMRQRWKKPNVFAGVTVPPYQATHAGDISKGQAVYTAACARCHGATKQQVGAAGSILDGAYLALINEQTVRTTIIAGRPDIEQPDWRELIPGRALTDDEITDVSAWLIAQKPAHPGHPYADNPPTSGQPTEAQPAPAKGAAH
jgi:cytochrome c oxidase cbb3-type subunit 3/ubiquinol-cytochrome c reductase cytochrome c subunit